jgi:hypothetical protein
MNREGSHIENMEVAEQELINRALDNDREKLEKGVNPEILKAASLLACGKRFGKEIAAEYTNKLFPKE